MLDRTNGIFSISKPFLLLLMTNVSFAETFFEISGKTEFELTVYADEGAFSGQNYQLNTALALVPEFYWEWDSGNNSLTLTPFIRADQRDDERSHGDVRELAWTHVGNRWEVHTGIRKVFWGVTEFNHLVDVINQTDGVESFDGEEKLGQPMIHLSYINDWGIVDGFVLPGFRERTFAGENGRLRSGLIVDADRAAYESADEEQHIDYALRWSHAFSVLDMGLYWFNGTDREPLLQAETINGQLRLIPFYQQVTQFGLDWQATIDSWLWKLEALYKKSEYKDSSNNKYAAAQTGFEYTFYGLNESPLDFGVLFEYGWDERGKNATAITQDDIYFGARLTLNDEDDSTLLMGLSYDRDYHTRSLLLEASKRLSDHWKIELKAFLLKIGDPADPARAVAQDDRVELILERFF